MKLSELNPEDVSSPSPEASSDRAPAAGARTTLRASELDPSDINFVADDANQAQYGGAGQQALAGVESIARGGSLGISDLIENQLAKSNPALFGPQARQGREEANPVTSFIGNAVGGGALAAATGGLGTEAALGKGLLGNVALGGAFGAGNAVSDYALGDPNLNAQKVMADIGMGAALGGGLSALSNGIGLAKTVLRKAPPEIGPVLDAAIESPNSLQGMKEAVEKAKKSGQEDLTELPQKGIAQDAAGRLNPELGDFAIQDAQMNSLDSQDDRNRWKVIAQVPGEHGNTIRNFEAGQKKQLVGILDNTIEHDVAPGYTPTSDAQEAGSRAADAFTNEIEGTRKELGPAFEQIKATPLADIDHLPGILDYLTNPEASPRGNPEIAKMFDTNADGIEIKPYNSQMGIAHTVYDRVKTLVTDLKSNPSDFEGIKNLREALTDKVNVLDDNRASKQLTQAKAAMMDYMQDMVQKEVPDLAVRDTFKKWAINEQNAQFIEKKLGAEIGSDNFRSLAKGKAEESILGKIFKDSAMVNAVKDILPPEEFNKMLADHLAILRNDATTDGVLSSKVLSNRLEKNQYALNAAFDGNAPAYQKMKDSLALARIFPDTQPANPSGTAPTFLQAVQNILESPAGSVGHLGKYAKGKISAMLEAQEINSLLAGTADKANQLNAVQGVLKRVSNQITSGAKAAVTSSTAQSAVKGAALSSGSMLSDEHYDKIVKQVSEMAGNPERFMDQLSSQTHHLYQAAPNVTQGVHTTVMQGVQFLNSKLPQSPPQMPFSSKWKPSIAQKMQFSQYYAGVDDPLGALNDVKSGSLTNPTMEALATVHPQLLQEMRSQVLSQMKVEKAKSLPYAQKLSLAKFLGQPLDENMTPLGIMANQLAMNAPHQSQQTSAAQASKSTLGGLKELNSSGRSATTTQRGLDKE